ncbi:MAG: hypothetical protein OHK005_05980 [Candidatus Methylacidiphilales bacterium]
MKWLRRLGWAGLLMLLGAAGILFYTMLWLQENITDVFAWAARRLGYQVVVERFEINSPTRVTFSGVTVAKEKENFIWFERLEIAWKWHDLFRRRLEEIRVLGAYVWLQELQEALGSNTSESDPNAAGNNLSLLLKRLVLREIVLNLNNLGPGIPNLPIRLAEIDPLVFNNLQLGSGRAEERFMQELQRAEVRDVIIYSPYFPLTPVLSFDRISFVFSMAGLAQQQLDRLSISRPTIYISQDLFWYLEDVKKAQTEQNADAALVPGAASKLWTIVNYDVRGGRLIVALDGTPTLVLPMVFETEGAGLILGDFSQLQLRTRFVIPPSNLDYPEYGVRIVNMRGELFFGLPPNQGEANIVPSVKMDEVRWKDLVMTNVDFGLTFTEEGIFGKFGGKAYSGYLDGGFAVYLRDNFPWQGWGSATGVNVRPMTELLSPHNFVMDGLVDGRFLVSAYARKIVGLEGEIDLNRPGTLQITAIDDLLGRIPEDWASMKQDMARIAMEAFQRYDYSQGRSSFRYAPPFSTLKLQLEGLQGKRDFDLTWTEQDAAGNPLPATSWSKE